MIIEGVYIADKIIVYEYVLYIYKNDIFKCPENVVISSQSISVLRMFYIRMFAFLILLV